jgi:hypothetical protein
MTPSLPLYCQKILVDHRVSCSDVNHKAKHPSDPPDFYLTYDNSHVMCGWCKTPVLTFLDPDLAGNTALTDVAPGPYSRVVEVLQNLSMAHFSLVYTAAANRTKSLIADAGGDAVWQRELAKSPLNAIKKLREISGMGLYYAKQAVYAYRFSRLQTVFKTFKGQHVLQPDHIVDYSVDGLGNPWVVAVEKPHGSKDQSQD